MVQGLTLVWEPIRQLPQDVQHILSLHLTQQMSGRLDVTTATG